MSAPEFIVVAEGGLYVNDWDVARQVAEALARHHERPFVVYSVVRMIRVEPKKMEA